MRAKRPLYLAGAGAVAALAILLLPPRAPDDLSGAPFLPLAGTVRDSATGRPLPHIWVQTRNFGQHTDSHGRFEVLVDTLPDTLRVEERGYVSVAHAVRIDRGTPAPFDFRVVPAAAPCCTLEGVWDAVFFLDSASARGPRPTARALSGTIVFADSIPSPWPRSRPDSLVLKQFGRSGLDFSPFFGSPIPHDVSYSVIGRTGPTFAREVDATVFDGDSIVVDLIPRITHGGVSFAGRVRRDSIEGRWGLRGYPGAYGHVRLHRRS